MPDDENIKQSENDSGNSVNGDEAAELEKCKKERDEYLAGWQRTKADFINYKNEEFKRLEEIVKYGCEDLISDLIVILDNFDHGMRALEKMQATPTPEGSESRPVSVGIDKGIYIIRSQIEDILKKRGLERISVAQGDNFDPAIAEAIVEVESDQPEGTIIEEIESGYRLHGKILRPARVKISKGKGN